MFRNSTRVVYTVKVTQIIICVSINYLIIFLSCLVENARSSLTRKLHCACGVVEGGFVE